MNCDEQPDRMEFEAQKPFKPFLAVRTVDCSVPACGTASHRVGSVFMVTGENVGSYFEENGISHSKNHCVKINPDILASLGYCDNPGVDAVLDELEMKIKEELKAYHHTASYESAMNQMLIWIASLRTSPPEPKPLDEAAIRADERANVIEEMQAWLQCEAVGSPSEQRTAKDV